jgi:hypothetical protein
MTVKINGETIDFTLENEHTLGEVLTALEASLSSQGAAVVGVQVDGAALATEGDEAAPQDGPGEALDKAAARPIAEVGELALEAITAKQLARALKGLCPAISTLAVGLKGLAVLLQSGKQVEAAALIAETSDTLLVFCRIARFTTLFPDDFPGLTPIISELPPVMTEFCQAMADTDIVLLGDLGEYEITPRLEALIRELEGLP